MGIFADCGVDQITHYAPLHYLIFIARSKSLLCKPSIREAGFPAKHFRSMSNGQDEARGFGAYAFLTLDRKPRILQAKLAAGFPHIGLIVPAAAVERTNFSLCRYNVAMTRYLRRNGNKGFPESTVNGRYYGDHQIPIAKSETEKRAMLEYYAESDVMIEVLVHGDLPLPDDTTIVCYSDADAKIAQSVLSTAKIRWDVTTALPPGSYPRDANYVTSVLKFLERAIANPDWRGDGLEFDRV